MDNSKVGMTETTVSNYEKLCEYWREQFLNMDHQELAAKLPELIWRGVDLVLTYFGKRYSINRENGLIQGLDEVEQPVSWGFQMILYNLLWFSKEGAMLSNQWVPFRSVKNAGPFAPAFSAHVLKPFSETFSGQVEKLHQAAQKLGGQPLPQGDAGYQINAFECIPIQFLFWDGDDEFPAQGNILFDYSVTDFIHVESTVSIAADGIARLAEVAGIPLLGDSYGS